jgi:multisubunit Na+/H+ antiporter MnhB subunit
LLTLLKPLALIILVTSVFLFWAGHNAPGGGFIAGLMFSGAILLIYLSLGRNFPGGDRVNYKILLPIGLSCAGGCGMIGVFFGAPFLSHTFEYFHLPFFGELELATATIFDFGVFLVVVGTVMSIVVHIGKEQEE